MHDCSRVEERLVDLVFDELDAPARLRLMAEIEACADCLSEYRSMTGTLAVFDQAVEASLPLESYWPEHHEALSLRLQKLALGARPKREPLWKRIFTARLPVPVPVAALLVLALLGATLFPLRAPEVRVQTLAVQAPPAQEAQARIVEVPVVQEKVVTRTVYLERRVGAKSEQRRQAPALPDNGSPLNARRSDQERGADAVFSSAHLTGFQPPDEMRIRVIKRSNSDEN